MSLSKLESLPNEILSDIIEKYINGVDVLIALSYQQNQRFNALITQSQRLRFDFIQCRKDDFRFCMGLLPAYLDKIEELAISEQNTPGQIHAFLNFFPSFNQFKRLRALYIHVNGEAVEWNLVARALLSLSKTSVDTLSIKATNTAKMHSLNNVMAIIFHLKSLKRLSFISGSNSGDWDFLTSVSSNLEHLTISDRNFQVQHLQNIYRCAPHLKYLNVQVTDNQSWDDHPAAKKRTEKQSILMSALRTLILSFHEDAMPTIDMLVESLPTMPVLNRLEIKADSEFLDADAWQLFLETSFPLLTHFNIWSTMNRIEETKVHDVLTSFQTPFWIGKKNFNIMITKHGHLDRKNVIIDPMFDLYQTEFDRPVIQWWMAPKRVASDRISPIDEITNLNISHLPSTLSCHRYFLNVKNLAVSNVDEPLLKWLITCIDCSQIRVLAVSTSNKETDALISLLSCATNISSLQINFNVLIALKANHLKKVNHLKRLDISMNEHAFNEDDIFGIAKLFPYLEHLKINTKSLYNVRMLKTYLPHLRSLTFKITDYPARYRDDYSDKMWESDLRRKTQFFFQCFDDSVTVWIDQGALEEPYWQTFNVESSQPPIASGTDATSGKKGINKLKSLFSLFSK